MNYLGCWKEAEAMGIWKDTKLKCHADEEEGINNKGGHTIKYAYDFDRLWDVNGLVYSNGQWVTPLNENKEIQEKIDSLQKQLDELKLKVR